MVEDAAQAGELPAVDRVLVVAPLLGLRRAAGADGGEWEVLPGRQDVPAVPVAVQPQADAALGGRVADAVPVA